MRMMENEVLIQRVGVGISHSL